MKKKSDNIKRLLTSTFVILTMMLLLPMSVFAHGVTINGPNTIEAGSPDVTFTLNIPGGVDVTNIVWSNGSITSAGVFTPPASVASPTNISISVNFDYERDALPGEEPEYTDGTRITGTDSLTHTITVNPAPVVHVPVTSITGVPTTATVGVPLALNGTVVPNNATNQAIAWAVTGGTATASIAGNTLTATTAGTVQVTATITNGLTATTDFTQQFTITVAAAPIVHVPVTSITGVPTTATVGVPLALNGTVVPNNATNQTITWAVTGGTASATITGSTLTATTAGTVQVTATIFNGLTATTDFTQQFTINVTSTPVATVNVTLNPASIAVGATSTATATLNGTTLAGSITNWVSATPAVATINSAGLITAVAPGTSVITGTFTPTGGGTTITGTATITVTAVATGNINVHFDFNGGTVPSVSGGSQTIAVANNATMASLNNVSVPTHTGFVFNGWYSPSHQNFVANLNTQVVHNGLSLTASWIPINPSWVNVVFNPQSGAINGSTSNFTIQMPIGATISNMFGYTNQQMNNGNTRFTPTRNNWSFQGWFLGNTNTQFNVTTPITNNMTINARWNDQWGDVQLIFNPNGGAWTDINWNWNNPWANIPASAHANRSRWINRNTSFIDHFGRTIPNEVGTVTRPNYVFNGWFIGNTNNQFTNNSSTNTANNSLTLNARWVHVNNWGGPAPSWPWGSQPGGPGAGGGTPTQPTTPAPSQPGNFPGFNFQPGAPTAPAAPIVVPNPAPTAPSITDVPAGTWFAPYVNNVTARGIMPILLDGNFHPDISTTRLMFAQALFNLAGQPAVFTEPIFTDVSPTDWFAPAVTWANSQGIVQGMGNNTFAGDANITREQLAVMVVRFSEIFGINLPQTNSSVNFVDAASVSYWATDAVGSIQTAGIIVGRPNGNFDPQENITRAEVAAIITRLINIIGSN